MKELAVTGRDLIRAGMKPGKEIGENVKRIIEPCDRESGNEYERDPVELYFPG